MPKQVDLFPETPVTRLSGVGPERAAQLARLGIRTVGDLLRHRPRRYEDRRHWTAIGDLRMGEAAATRGRIVAQGLKWFRHRSQSVFEIILEDGTGRLHCRWWNLPFMEHYFHQGAEVMVFGRMAGMKPRTMDHPETEVAEPGEETSIHMDRIVPVYPLTEGVPQRWLRGLVWRVLEACPAGRLEPFPDLRVADLPGSARALRQLHRPESPDDPEQARTRLALDEFLDLQLGIQRRRRHLQTHAVALPCAGTNRLIKPFLAALGFTLTAAQTRVLREIRHDLNGAQPMRRLLQGDVGSGKTVVAACAALMAVESGYHVALMAPTEILAEQHYRTMLHWFGPLKIPVRLHTASRKPPQAGSAPGAAPAAPAEGTAGLAIGTHALIEDAFAVERLGLVIIDEQHKFGVAQRERLVRKGHYPHVLVMTATPIPRTLGLTLYGDLDLSVIDQLPPGRGRLRTFVRGAQQLARVHAFVRQQIDAGRQAYVVYPRAEEADTLAGIKAVTREFERLKTVFAPHPVGLLHGRLRTAEKERVMAAFRANRTRVLVATSIVEVGVDVPNATVMLIENAEQFGLAQLHQLRGRIGRGPHESYCILVAHLKSPEARERLRVMEQTTDGFRLAEADLQLRGPGELLGQAQSGLPPFRFGDLANDLALIERARLLARTLLKPPPHRGAP
ncbi:MAG: ATP-dependent DNA helicase RecG [Verrucomicrobia bacterium]|nr:ATP-dependent DNA helicase RecG [Verrucomicrobiota bacterium]